MKKEYKGIPFVKLENGNNLVRIADIYGFNNSEEEYTELTDEMLEVFNKSFRDKANTQRQERGKAMSFDENILAYLEDVKTDSAEDTYLWEENTEDIENLRFILGKLTETQKRRLFMRYALNMSYTDIGREENVSRKAIVYSCEAAIYQLNKYSNILQEMELKHWVYLLICTNF